MGLIVTDNGIEEKNFKSVVQLEQETKNFLENQIYPYLKDERAWIRFKNYLEAQADRMKSKYGY